MWCRKAIDVLLNFADEVKKKSNLLTVGEAGATVGGLQSKEPG